MPARVVLLIAGKPNKQPHETLVATLGVSDDEGSEQRVRVSLRGVGIVSSSKVDLVETGFSISDELEKSIVAVLQSELHRYDKCGRRVGGLGSIHVVYEARAMTGFGSDSWTSNSPENQSIVKNPEDAALQSDNLEAISGLFVALSSDKEKKRFIEMLLARIGIDKGYVRITYFIVCALWKLGHLDDALRTAKETLPQGEIKAFGLSNVLMMLNGLLRYRHPDFTDAMLDSIESSIHDLDEHSFGIAEKISSIRTTRLIALRPT